MLLVGRELYINDKQIVCRMCSWEGAGDQLHTGLVQVSSTPMYFYAYRCPECCSFDLVRQGKLLQFRSEPAITREDRNVLPANSLHLPS